MLTPRGHEPLAQRALKYPALHGTRQRSEYAEISSLDFVGHVAGEAELRDEPDASNRSTLNHSGDHGEACHTGCVGCPSMMDCSHSIAVEEMDGQIGGFS